MKRLLFLLLPLSLHAQQTGDELLDLALQKPDYSQMCDVATVPRSPKLPLYGITSFSEYSLSNETLQKLRASRDLVVPALAARLSKMSFDDTPVEKETQFKEGDFETVIDSGIDPKVLSTLYFDLIAQLNATECLETLLKLEKDLVGRLEKNHADPIKNPLPELRLTHGFVVENGAWMKRNQDENASDEPSPEFLKTAAAETTRVDALITQRNLLATMLILLKQEKYPPLFNSPIHKKSLDALIKNAQREDLKHITSPELIPESERAWIGWDADLKIPFYKSEAAAQLPYNPALRQEILDLTRGFLKEVPKEKWLGSKGIPK